MIVLGWFDIGRLVECLQEVFMRRPGGAARHGFANRDLSHESACNEIVDGDVLIDGQT